MKGLKGNKMTISIEQLNDRKTKLAEDFNTVSKRIEDGELRPVRHPER